MIEKLINLLDKYEQQILMFCTVVAVLLFLFVAVSVFVFI